MMKLEIQEEVLNGTTRCRKEFACLSGTGECLCDLKYCLGGKSYFIRADKDMPCNYKVNFGNYILCSCPTRKEIYNQYNM